MGKGITFSLGLGIFLGIFVFSIAAGGSFISFIHYPSALFVLGTAGGLGLASYHGNGFLGYMAACKKHLITAGILGTIIGVILLLQNISNPDDLGGGLAVALLTLLYSVILFGIFEAFITKVGTEQAQT